MAVHTEKNAEGVDIIIDGWETGIATSPHKGVGNLQGVNIATESGEVLCSNGRVQQSQTAGNGELTQVNTNTVTFSSTGGNVVPLVGSWIQITFDMGTGLSGYYYVVDTGKLSQTFSQNNSTEVTGIGSGFAAFTIVSMGVPVQSATEYYTDSSGIAQNRYYILDNLGQVWVHDTATLSGVSTPVWFLPEMAPNVTFTTASGLAVLNGWLSIMLDATIYWKPTVDLGRTFDTFSSTAGAGITGTTITKKFHATLTGHTGELYYTDGNYLGSMFPTTGTALDSANIQSYSQYTTQADGTVSSLIVAGGGGGASRSNRGGGGGGGGGVIYTTGQVLAPAAYTVVVGAGGAGGAAGGYDGTAGGNSSFNSLTAIGGAKGISSGNGANGGSGSGGSGDFNGGGQTGGTGTAGQGNNGGAGGDDGVGDYFGGGGGGGAGAAGGTGTDLGGNGGNGLANSISGSSVTYAGGGGGGSAFMNNTGDGHAAGTGGTGGGGNGSATVSTGTPGGAGTANTGGGGGGSNYAAAGNGGSGIVIISYPTGTVIATGGTVTTSGGNTIHTFTTGGTFTVSGPDDTMGTITDVLSGAYPNTGGASTLRVPATFFTTIQGTQPTNLTIGTTYWIQNTPGTNTFTVYAGQDPGTYTTAIDINTGSSGPQYFNTFNPTADGCLLLNNAIVSGATGLISTLIKVFLPPFETAQCLTELGSQVLIGGLTNTVYSWDQTSLTAQYIPLPESNVVQMITVNNLAYLLAGSKGNVYLCNGSAVSAVISVPDYCAGIPGTPNTYIEPYFKWGGLAYIRGRVYFSIQDQTSTKTGNCGGIWSFIPTQNLFYGQDTGLSLRMENVSSYGTNNGYCPVLLQALNQNAMSPQYWSAWVSSVTSPLYGIDFTATIPQAGVIESDLISTGNLLEKKTFSQISYKLATPLASGETIGISYRQNGTDAWTALTNVNVESATALSGYYTVSFQNGQWLQLQISLNPLFTTSSSYCRLLHIRIR